MNPGNAGRNFNNHFATSNVNPDGSWRNLMAQKNAAADLSPTAAQMPRLVGLAYASKLFRHSSGLEGTGSLTENGNEVAFGMIGDASTSEGHFFETMNAAAVMQIPMAVAVWDDGYGISVTREYQTVKESISAALKGFEANDKEKGILIYHSKGWDYPELCRVFEEGIQRCRDEHIPVLFHIDEMVQPLGHSTSGSHERYKSKERLEWEKAFDPLKKMREWVLENDIATEEDLEVIEREAVMRVKQARETAWANYTGAIKKEREELVDILVHKKCKCITEEIDKIRILRKNLQKVRNPIRKDNFSTAKKVLRHICLDCPVRQNYRKKLIPGLTSALMRHGISTVLFSIMKVTGLY